MWFVLHCVYVASVIFMCVYIYICTYTHCSVHAKKHKCKHRCMHCMCMRTYAHVGGLHVHCVSHRCSFYLVFFQLFVFSFITLVKGPKAKQGACSGAFQAGSYVSFEDT